MKKNIMAVFLILFLILIVNMFYGVNTENNSSTAFIKNIAPGKKNNITNTEERKQSNEAEDILNNSSVDVQIISNEEIERKFLNSLTKSVILEDGSFNYSVVNSLLESDGFVSLLDEARKATLPSDIDNYFKLEQVLLDITILNQYHYEFACKDGVCVLLVQGIDVNDYMGVSSAISDSVKRGNGVRIPYWQSEIFRDLRFVFVPDFNKL